jgi:microcystin-dependent protein
MGKFKRKCLIFIFVTYIIGLGFILPFYPVLAYPTYPQTGIIAMWSGGSIPTGWEEVSVTNGRFVMGTTTGETPGATGGSSTHRHVYTQIPSHSHGSTSTYSTTHTHTYRAGGPTAANGNGGSDILTFDPTSTIGTGLRSLSHSHTVYSTGSSTCYSAYSSTYPPYQSVRYIKKVSASALYPAGLIVISTNGITPSGWVRCDGSNGTPDLRGDFLMGSSSPGTTGGSETHRHSYTQVPYHGHSMSSHSGSHNHGAIHDTMTVLDDDLFTIAYQVITATGGYSGQTNPSHSHSVAYVGSSTCYTGYSSVLPPYKSVDFLMSQSSTTALPVGIVALWAESASSIPLGWNPCDGSFGTEDLRNRYVRGRNTEPIGTIGGSSSHSHTYTTVPRHTHSTSTASINHNHPMNTWGGYATGGAPLLGGGFSVYTDYGDRTSTSSSITHSHTVYSSGGSGLSTQTGSNHPPYVKLTFIECLDYDGNTPVFTDTPLDREIEYGYYTGESISWTATDTNPDTYSIDLLGSGMVVSPTPWSSGGPITYNIPDGFSIGTYTYEIELLDDYSNPSTDSVTISIVDSTKPVITDSPSPLVVEYGYTNKNFTWTATELNPDYYQIERLDTGIVVGPSGWTSGSPVTYNIPDGLGTGTYSYNITFVDDYGNSESDVVEFTVEDTNAPVILEAPSDVVFEYGDTAPVLYWNVTDPYPGFVNITISNDPYVTDDPWTSGTLIEFDLDPLDLDVDVHSLVINISDLDGNYATDSVTITIEDTIDPVITATPSDVTVESGYTNQSVSWTATDLLPDTYKIELEGSGIVVDHTDWVSGDPVTFNFPDGLATGNYTYTITFYDESGNIATDEVLFVVNEPSRPTIPGFSIPMLLAISVCVVVMAIIIVKKKSLK